ncbi:MAG: T9SS type A sorting domain-containing protein [Bacteroidota bacterium]
MKHFYITLIFICALAHNAFAQDGYTYSLIHNGSYSFTVQAVPNTSSNNFATSVQSYGFTLVVPDGVSITQSSSLGGTALLNFFDGSAIGQAAIDGYLVTETLGSPVSLPAPSAATNSDLLTFTVNGSPTSGTMYILENNSGLATTITALKSFMQADMIDDGSAQFANVVDPNAPAVTAPSSFNFSILSVEDKKLINDEVTLFPNPTRDFIHINSTVKVNSYTLYDLLGKQISDLTSITEDQKIDLSDLSDGVYMLKLYLDNNSSVVREIIKN